jgi:hypothetical protein
MDNNVSYCCCVLLLLLLGNRWEKRNLKSKHSYTCVFMALSLFILDYFFICLWKVLSVQQNYNVANEPEEIVNERQINVDCAAYLGLCLFSFALIVNSFLVCCCDMKLLK